MSRIHFKFIYQSFLKSKEEVCITDTAIVIKQSDGFFHIPLRDIKQIAVAGPKSILVGYGTSDDQMFFYTIKAVHSSQIVVDKMLLLIRKNKCLFTPKSIGYV